MSGLTSIHSKKAQSGRSMIEMLGVLAIIGVLSVGGIAGYTKAMTKYKINKTIDQITQLAQNIRAFYATQKDYGTLNETVIKKGHLAPDEMWNSAGTMLENPFGGEVFILAFNKYVNSDDRKAFVIRMYGVPEEACVELLTQDWGVGSSSGLIAVGADVAYDAALGGEGSSSGYYDGYWVGGSSGYSNSNLVTFASEGVMGLDKAAALCEDYHDSLMWKFY